MVELPTHHNFKNRLGDSFGRLVVIGYAGFENQNHKWICLCSCGNQITVSRCNLLRTMSCGCLAEENRRAIVLSLEEKLRRVAENTDYDVYDSKTGKSNFPWIFICKAHGKFQSLYNDVVNRGTSCPSCVKFGFNQKQGAYLYIMLLRLEGHVVGYKFGITNNDVDARARQLSRGSDVEITPHSYFYFKEGADALTLERQIRTNFKEKLISRTRMPVGHTETFSPSKLLLVVQQITEFIKYKETI